MPDPTVTSGQIMALRMFDIANAIDLTKAEALWDAHAAGRSARARLTGTPAKAMSFDVPPLALIMAPVVIQLESGSAEASVVARLYDFGAVSIALRVPVNDKPWVDFAWTVNAIARAAVPSAEHWDRLLSQLRSVLAPALDRPVSSAISEDYLISTVQSFDTPLTAADLLSRVDLVHVLSEESRPLSDPARADLLRSRFSWYQDDLVVLTWDRAFIFEPRGDSDVADVLEVANAQLLEMRYYDELLDDELPRMYDLVQHARRRSNMFSARRYAGLARRLHTLVAEVTELTERVDNALQVTEDVYLARVYAAALEMFRVRLVSAAVDRKLSIIRDTYAALYDEASSARSEMMEIAVIILIAMELALAAWRH
jgi:hypothetical protein